ncbi:hypothetical protein GCM10011409_22690 [Lentibacillus populi]|uniref:Peptidylprolyl isomerase n=1 Tax=Lentibacillus populi TaxID=1827502 RepID=A0A9W5TXT7_9BACI|nr:SurA N-terminal domain-containing protein [Lentibacillus populi]GGB44561.1 hypothetical protein GCM10011409_22690 [Lentibacillus populi]
MKKLVMLVVALSIVTMLAACGNNSDSGSSSDAGKKSGDQNKTEQQAKQAQDKDVKISDDEKVNKDDVVVQVNDTKIKGDQYNNIYAQTKVAMNQFGEDVSDKDQLKEQAINVLVQQELLKQDAKKQGIDISGEKVQSEFEKIKAENEDQFAAVLEQYQLSEQAYKDQLAFELTVDEYINKEITGTDVTDKEIKSYYDKLKEQSKDIPELKKVKEQIKDELTKQKENEKLQAKINELKKDAEIKNMI